MNRTGTVIIVVIAILVVVGGIVLATHKSGSPAATSSPAANSNAAATTPPAANSSPTASTATDSATDVTLHYTASGFSPSTITVPTGHKLIVKNDSSATIQVDSNPHPQHTDDTQLNIGTISPGATGSATLTRAGSWGIHNHLDPAMLGTVVVK
jgi:plastocyanin